MITIKEMEELLKEMRIKGALDNSIIIFDKNHICIDLIIGE